MDSSFWFDTTGKVQRMYRLITCFDFRMMLISFSEDAVSLANSVETYEISCADPEKFCHECPNLSFFVFYERREDPNSTIRGPSSAFELCFAGGPMMAQTLNAGFGSLVNFQGIWHSIAKKPYIFVIFRGASGPSAPLPPLPLDPRINIFHMCILFLPTYAFRCYQYTNAHDAAQSYHMTGKFTIIAARYI